MVSLPVLSAAVYDRFARSAVIRANVPVTDMDWVPEPATITPLASVMPIVPLIALRLTTIVPGLLAANASATDTPVTATVVPAVTFSVFGAVMTGPVGTGSGGAVAILVTAETISTSTG